MWAGRLGNTMATRKRHTPEQVVRKLAQAGRMLGEGKDVAEVCRELQVSEQTYYRWRNQFGGLKAGDAKRLKDLEKENSTLKRLLADAELEKDFAAARANDRWLPGHPGIPAGGPRSQAVSPHARLRT
jgi:transposase-like protein